MVEPVPSLVIGCLLLAVLATGMALGALAMRNALRRGEGMLADTLGEAASGSGAALGPVAAHPSLDQVFRSMPNGGVLVFDRDMCVRLSEGDALPVLGLLRGRSEDMTLWQSFPREAAQRLEPVLRRSLLGERGAAQLNLSGRPVLVSCGPLESGSGEVTGAVAVLQAVDALAEVDELPPPDGRKITAEQEIARLRQRNKALADMSTTAAHDLREPLRTVATHLSLVRRRAKERLDAQSRAHLILADDGIRRAERMILDILDYATLGEPRPRERVALAEALALALRDLSTKVEETGANIDIVDPLPTVYGVRGQLHRLFLNLLSNALRHRPVGTVPVIRIGCKEDGGMWKVTIADNGNGIDHPQREKVFEPLRRLARSQPGPSGSGMGLAIARRIVELHGGRIWIEGPGESISGGTFQGCTFSFTLPAASADDSLIRLSPAQLTGVKS